MVAKVCTNDDNYALIYLQLRPTQDYDASFQEENSNLKVTYLGEIGLK